MSIEKTDYCLNVMGGGGMGEYFYIESVHRHIKTSVGCYYCCKNDPNCLYMIALLHPNEININY